MSAGYKSSSDVQAMFGRIASRYDLMNRLMTFGQDRAWRRYLVGQLGLNNESVVLDIASGTGDIAFEIRRQYPGATVIAGDFALPMMQVGKRRKPGSSVEWSAADALNLPFPDGHFDAVVSGYLLRNVPDIPRALAEQWRVLKPGGYMATLDSSPPKNNPLKPFIVAYLKYVIPTLGGLITPDPDAYAYLPASTMRFKTPQDLAALLHEADFPSVDYKTFMFGTMAVHWAQKPPISRRHPGLEDAIALAVAAHRGQTDKSGMPYILHPLRIMAGMSTKTEMMVAALHDVVEDTPYTLDDLRELGYPAEVVMAVDALSRREGEAYKDYIERLSENPLAVRVKRGDLQDNMDVRRMSGAITADDAERLERYRRAWERLK